MTIPLYPIAYPGGSVRIEVRFSDSETNETEALTEPVAFIVTAPSGIQTHGVATALDTGSYQLNFVPAESGRHVIFIRSSGGDPAVGEEEFVVRELLTDVPAG